MLLRKRHVRYPKSSRRGGRSNYKDMGKAMFESCNGPCLIPSLPDDGFPETNRVSDCHVIGAQFLKLIANSRTEICTWNMNAHQIGKNALHASWDISESPPAPYFEPFNPDKKPISFYHAKSKFACQRHRSKVFKDIDNRRTFAPTDPEHQFRLGLRVVAATVANTQGVLTYCGAERTKYLNPKHVRRTARLMNMPLPDYEVLLQSFLDKTGESIQDIEAAARMLRTELREWQEIYESPGERQITSCHILARPSIRLAISSVGYQENHPITMCTVLPRAVEEPGYNRCDVILSIRKPKSGVPIWQAQFLEDQALKIKTLLEGDPATSLTGLVRSLSMNPTTFFFVSPDDYYNDEIISGSGRSKIEQDVASIANSQFPG